MNVKILGLVTLFALSLTTTEAVAAQKEKFKVSGKCGMCETRIEKAALSVDGVKSADWDKESSMIAVKFDSKKTDGNKIQLAIAEAGHDTELHKADQKVYDKLPECCKYEREEATATAGCGGCPSTGAACPGH